MFKGPGEVLALLTVLGFLVYGLVRVTYDSFYYSLGLTVEEVGLAYATILSHAAIGAAMILMGILLLVAGGYFAGGALLDETEVNVGTRIRNGLLVGAYFLAVLIVGDKVSSGVGNLAYRHLGSPWGGAFGSAAFIVSVFVMALLLAGVLGAVNWLRERLSSEAAKRKARNRLIFTTIPALVALFAMPYFAGKWLAVDVSDGDLRVVGNPITRIVFAAQAQRVRVAWIQGTRPNDLPVRTSFIFLGQSGELTILYDVDGKKVYRVPSQSVILLSY